MAAFEDALESSAADNAGTSTALDDAVVNDGSTFIASASANSGTAGIDVAGGAKCRDDAIAGFDNRGIGNNLGQREYDSQASVRSSLSEIKFFSSSEAGGRRRCKGYSRKCSLIKFLSDMNGTSFVLVLEKSSLLGDPSGSDGSEFSQGNDPVNEQSYPL